jgi:hypothetical protein
MTFNFCEYKDWSTHGTFYWPWMSRWISCSMGWSILVFISWKVINFIFTHIIHHKYIVIIISKDIFSIFPPTVNHIGGVMAGMLASRAVDLGVEPRSSQTKDYKIGICYFFAKHATLRRKSKDWLAWNRDNVSKWGDMSTCGLLFRWASTIKTQLSMLI